MAFDTLKNLEVKSPYDKEKYDNYINNQWVKPVDGKYFENITPISGKPFCEVARSNEKDINLALDAAHAAKDAWGKTSATERANILMKIADSMEQNLESISLADTIDNGNPFRECLAADIPLAID
nr:aldehyde dehydrogenase family protein [Betaproteobacteria bacterium]